MLTDLHFDPLLLSIISIPLVLSDILLIALLDLCFTKRLFGLSCFYDPVPDIIEEQIGFYIVLLKKPHCLTFDLDLVVYATG